MGNHKPRILLTGGTTGIGYGIAQRMIDSLLTPPQSYLRQVDSSPYHTEEGLTLILPCRDIKKGEVCKKDLYKYAKNTATRPTNDVPLAAYRADWYDNFEIIIIEMDLSSNQSILDCSNELKQTQPYLTHLVLNAGCGPFKGIDWVEAVKALLTDFIGAVSVPYFIVQNPDVAIDNGVGFTWQCNVAGHYCLTYQLLDLLEKAHERPRVLWTGSLEGKAICFDKNDPYALKPGAHTYQSTKYQTGLVANGLNNRFIGQGLRTRSFLVAPGVAAGDMFKVIIGIVLHYVMICAFYIARTFGSTNHNIAPYKAAVAYTHVCFAPFDQLEDQIGTQQKDKNQWPVFKYSSRSDRWGNEYYTVDHPEQTKDPTLLWWNDKDAAQTLKCCEDVCQSVSQVKN